MAQNISILDSKFNPPKLSQIIKREERYPFLDQIFQNKVTTIVAGAGYGKSTAVADFLMQKEVEFVWFNLEEGDQDISVFLRIFFTGIKKHFPRFGESIQQLIEGKEDSEPNKDVLFPSLIKEIEGISTEEMAIVLDDYHLLRDAKDVNSFLKYLIDHLPGSLHIVVNGRSAPGFPLSRLRAQNELLEMTEKELSFNLAEIRTLYHDLYQIPLPENDLELLLKKTEGWISGIILFYHFIRDKTSLEVPIILNKFDGSIRMVSFYLKENLLMNQPDFVRDFLLFTSILSRINPSFSDELLSINNSKEVLSLLEENHLFTFCIDEKGKWYRYHPLLQNFMVNTLLEKMGKDSFYALNVRTAKLWEEFGEKEEALRHYFQAEDWGNATRVLNTLIRSLLKESRYKAIGTYLSKLPLEFIENEPWLLYANGLILEFRGEFAASINLLQKALPLFLQSNDKEGTDTCLIRLPFLYYASGDIPKAKDYLLESKGKVEGNIVFHIHSLINLSVVSCVSGRMGEAHDYLKEASSLVERVKDARIKALFYFAKGQYYHFSGDFLNAIEFGKRANSGFANTDSHQFRCLSHHLLSCSYFYLGKTENSLEEAKQGLKIAMEYGFKEASYAWLLLDEAMYLKEMGRFSDALATARAGEDVFANIGSKPGGFWAIQTQRDCYFKMGNLDSAREHAERALRILKDIQLPTALAYAKGSLAELEILDGDIGVALSLLEDAEEILNRSGSHFHLTRIYLLQARLFWTKGEKTQAIEKLKNALELSDKYSYDFWIAKEEEWIIPLLLELLINRFNNDHIKDIFAIIEPGRVREEVSHFLKGRESNARNKIIETVKDIIYTATLPLRIYTLGKFRVFKGGEEIPTASWKSKKAIFLLQYLLTKGKDEFIHKEVLMEALWPDRNPKASAHNLQVALSYLRHALEPDLPPYFPSSYILRSGDYYRLDLGKDGWLDRDLFENRVLKAMNEETKGDNEKALSYYLEAERIYVGDYLNETLFEDWCEAEKERLREDYISVLIEIMRLFEDKRDINLSIEYAGKILNADKYFEDIYCRLMEYYAILGKKDRVIKTYKSCRVAMKEGLDSDLSSETVELYERLMEWGSDRNNL
ncbi:MAG: hypothetical protein HY739_07570 [Desulfobacterales bacterium]|nr:hypothetical protein [Desulfobacterales bacterium]